MSWVKLDDSFYSHPKARAAGLHGRSLFIAGLCWTKRHLTDGLIPKRTGALLIAEAEVPKSTVAHLVHIGMWHDEGDHWRINDFHDWQEAADVQRRRKLANAERSRKWREEQRVQREAGRNGVRDSVRMPYAHYLDTDTDTDTDTDIETTTTTRARIDAAIGTEADRQTDLAVVAGRVKGSTTRYRAAIVKRLQSETLGVDVDTLDDDQLAALINPDHHPAAYQPAPTLTTLAVTTSCVECGQPLEPGTEAFMRSGLAWHPECPKFTLRAVP